MAFTRKIFDERRHYHRSRPSDPPDGLKVLLVLTRRRVAASLAVLPALGMPVIARAAAAPKTIRIGMAMAGIGGRPYSFGSALAVVHVQGLLEKTFSASGTSIEWNFFTGAGPAVNEALANDALDFAWQGDLPEIVARSRGLGTQQLLVAGNRMPVYLVVAKNSKIGTLADLRGKAVANFQGTNMQLAVDRILASAGLTEQDLHIVNLDPLTARVAVADHQIDASFTQLPLVPQMLGRLKIIFHTGASQPVLTTQTSVIATDAFITAFPEAVDQVVKVIVGAAQWSSREENREALYEIYGKTGYPPAIIKGVFDPIDLLTFSSPQWDGFARAQLDRSAVDSFRFGLSRTKVDPAGWINTGPLDRALASLNLQHYWPQYAPDGVTKLS